MALRQYIGARYVPKFYDNPGGGSDWISGVAYEALTVVTYGGNSYTSKKIVPAGIGNPAANPEYWASTGIYSAQVESLREEVQDLADDYAAIAGQAKAGAAASYFHGKKICVYGDSISVTPTPETSYWGILSSEYGLDITNRAIAGSSLEGSLSTILAATDLALFDVIVLAFGTNEWQASKTFENMQTNYTTAVSFIQAQAPLAKIVFVTPIYGHNNEFNTGILNVNDTGRTLEYYVKWINDFAYHKGCGVIDMYHTSGCNEYNYTQLLEVSTGFGDIYVHPNAAFAEQMATIVLNATFDSTNRIDTVNKANYFTVRDFSYYLARQVDLASMPQLCRGGLKVKIPASSVASVTCYVPPAKMHMAFAISGACTISIVKGAQTEATFDVAANTYFDTVIDFNKFSNGVESYRFEFTNNTAGDCYIGRMLLCEINTNYGAEDFYNTGVGLTAANGVSFNGTPRVMSDDKTLSLTSGHMTLTRDFNNEALATFTAARFPGNGYFFTAIGSDRVPRLIYLNNYSLSAYGLVPAGSYRIIAATLNPYYQD